MADIDDLLIAFIKNNPSDHNAEAIEHILYARRKLQELELGLTQYQHIGLDDKGFKELYNQFRRGRKEND